MNKAITGGLLDIIDFTPYPYGNAKRSSSGQITCQHGPAECTGNLNLNCLVHEAGNQTSIYWPAWACIEGSEDPIKDAANCVTQAGISWLKVSSCASGALGKALVNAAADATEALSPPHKFVPWVTVNGAPLGENDLPNLVSIVCKAYQGQTKPAICNN